MVARRLILAAAASLALISPAAAQSPQIRDPENTLILDLSSGGPVVIAMRPDIAPAHVTQIKTLVRQGFYNGVVFHRVIEGFMAQTGDPTGTGTGRSPLPNIRAEFSREPHTRGAVSMARSSDPNSANSQFFIMFASNPGLDGQYSVWGRVISG
ncbi:MAG: peptidylprolyl isomerase, partial [Alphaproteobacteria bacterium]|nr:peptidylprolyl isomerase [Alphaproteobacteria bacterium]